MLPWPTETQKSGPTEVLDWLSQANGLSIKDIALNSNLRNKIAGLPSFPAARGFGRPPGRSTNPEVSLNPCQSERNKKSTKNVWKPHTLISERPYSARHAWSFCSTARTANGPQTRPVRRVGGRG